MKKTIEFDFPLDEKSARIIKGIIEQGWATNFDEALRLALFDYMHHNPEIMKEINKPTKEKNMM